MSPYRLFSSLQPGVSGFPYSKLRILGMVPVVIVLIIFSGAYYAAVPISLVPTLSSAPILTTALLLIYHVVFLLALSSFLLTVFTDPGQLPSHFKIPKLPHHRLPPLPGSPLYDPNAPEPPPPPPIPDFLKEQWERTYGGERRYCTHCLGYKPDRTHHCRQCGKCVRRMDHHCVFVNNCVGFFNYKFFLLFLLYASLGCALTTIFGGPNFASVVRSGKFLSYESAVKSGAASKASSVHAGRLLLSVVTHKLGKQVHRSQHSPSILEVKEVWFVLGYVVAFAFTIALCIFNGFHVWLLISNRTTIEQYETSDSLRYVRIQSYNLGRIENIRSALGKETWTWFLPIRYSIPGDGVNFGPTRQPDRDEEEGSTDPLIANQID